VCFGGLFFVLGLYIKVRPDCSPLEMSSASCVSMNAENAEAQQEALNFWYLKTLEVNHYKKAL